MPDERDKYLFHYTTREAALSHIVPARCLRFSRYADMRDPLENKSWNFGRFGAGAWGVADAVTQRRQAGKHGAFEWLATEIRNRSFLLSMTQDSPVERAEEWPFFHGWARARMWEQYAEKHLGVCLVFDRDQFIKDVDASLRRQGFPAAHHHEVDYGANGMEKPLLDLNELPDEITTELVGDYVERNHDILFFHKVLDWETEHEYRFVTTTPDGKTPFVEFGAALVGVIVGEKFPRWARPGVIAACEEAGADAEIMDWSMGAPAHVALQVD